MRNFIIKRILLSVLILFFVALIVYTIMRCIPTSYVETIALQRSTQPGSKSYQEWLDQLNESFGMNTNIITGFFIWIKSAITGDFGDSWLYGIPVIDKFKDVIWDSVVLGAVAFVIEIIIAIPLGIISATKQYSKTDYALTVFALLGISLPTFFIATILKLVFSIHLGWFDLYGKVGRFYTQMTPVEQWFDVAKHFVLPVITLTLVSVGSLVEYGSKASLFKEPLHPYTKALFSAIPIPDPSRKMNRIILEGSIPSPANPPPGCKNCMEICKSKAPEAKEIHLGHYVLCHLYNEEKE